MKRPVFVQRRGALGVAYFLFLSDGIMTARPGSAGFKIPEQGECGYHQTRARKSDFPPSGAGVLCCDSVVVAGLAWGLHGSLLCDLNFLRRLKSAPGSAGDAGSEAFVCANGRQAAEGKNNQTRCSHVVLPDASITRYLAPTEIVGVSGAL